MTFIEQKPSSGKTHNPLLVALSRPEPQDKPGEFFYRYYEVIYSNGVDEYGDPLPGEGRLAIQLMKIPVLKTTRCGAWIGWNDDDKRFVNLSWNKRYALPSIEEARSSFIARKKREALIMAARLRHAERAMQIAQAMWAAER